MLESWLTHFVCSLYEKAVGMYKSVRGMRGGPVGTFLYFGVDGGTGMKRDVGT
jgi:hypothetical protein